MHIWTGDSAWKTATGHGHPASPCPSPGPSARCQPLLTRLSLSRCEWAPCSPVALRGQQQCVPSPGLTCGASQVVRSGEGPVSEHACGGLRLHQAAPGVPLCSFKAQAMKKSFPQWKHVCSAISLLRHAFVVWQPTGMEAALARLRGNSRPGQKHRLEKATQQGEENPTLTWQQKPPDGAYLLVSSLYRLCLPIHARTVSGPNIEVGNVGGEDHLLESIQPRDDPSYTGGRERNKHMGGGTAVPCSA